jgi:hypothetical protein
MSAVLFAIHHAVLTLAGLASLAVAWIIVRLIAMMTGAGVGYAVWHPRCGR